MEFGIWEFVKSCGEQHIFIGAATDKRLKSHKAKDFKFKHTFSEVQVRCSIGVIRFRNGSVDKFFSRVA